MRYEYQYVDDCNHFGVILQNSLRSIEWHQICYNRQNIGTHKASKLLCNGVVIVRPQHYNIKFTRIPVRSTKLLRPHPDFEIIDSTKSLYSIFDSR